VDGHPITGWKYGANGTKNVGAERTLWEVAARTDPNGDPGLVALQEEATRCLATHGSKRRVLAIATVGK
jgi:hypothetical protein